MQNTIDQPRALFRVPLTGSTVRAWRMPVGDEDGTGRSATPTLLPAPGSKFAAQSDSVGPRRRT